MIAEPKVLMEQSFDDIKGYVSRLPLNYSLVICDTTTKLGREAFIIARMSRGGDRHEANRNADALALEEIPGWATVTCTVVSKIAREIQGTGEEARAALAKTTGRRRLVVIVGETGPVYTSLRCD